jgi:ATP-dependent DNA helicase DinG
MEDVFGPGGLIARSHPNYEHRPGQIEMAEAVSFTLNKGGISLIEAGTGTGKTLAYLIPALAAGRRVVVSTATKNLQEQLFNKDVPFLQKTLPQPFEATCMKGRSNYLCLYRLKKAEHAPLLQGVEDLDYLDKVRDWAATTETGDRAELDDLPENLSFWPEIDARGEVCLGQKCPDFDACFITRMRQRALEADVVIVNHHLFFADLALRGDDYGSVLPEYSTVIFDEAHELEDVAAGYFGASISTYRINDLIHDANKLQIDEPERAAGLTSTLARLAQRSDSFFFSLVANLTGARVEESRPRSGADQPERFVLNNGFFFRTAPGGELAPTAGGEAYTALVNAFNRVIGELNMVKEKPPEIEKLVRRAESLKFDLDFIVACADDTFVYWCERRGRGVFLHATPIDVSGILDDKLFSEIHSAVLTSATLTAAGSFEFIKSRLGIRSGRGLIVESHFDYQTQSVLYLPKRMPDPRSPDFLRASVDEIVHILEATSGRAFVLFTSAASMRQAFEMARDRIPFPAFLQGQASKSRLLELFRTTEGAVLFATSSFWQGVDVQGEALSCVIICKLPFAVPSDPVIAARQNYIDSRGGNSFYQYSVPEAIIALKQGLGRLIRSTTDRGVLSILDPRIKTKAYGRMFMQSLPRFRITANLEEAAAIFSASAGTNI